MAYWGSSCIFGISASLGIEWPGTGSRTSQCLRLAALDTVKEPEGGKSNRAGHAAVVQVQVGYFDWTVGRLRHIRPDVRVQSRSLFDDDPLGVGVIRPIHVSK